MPKVRLTNTVVETAKCPPGNGRREWWDSVSTGLVLRVTESGAKSWYAIYRSPVTNKQTKLRLGDVKETDASNGLTLAQARSENVKVQGGVDARRDPRIERARAQAEERQRLDAERHERSHATFSALVDDYLAEKQGLRPGTLKTYRSVLDREILPALSNKLVREVTALDLEALIERIAKQGKRARARTIKTALGSIWGWARRTAKWRALGLDARHRVGGQPGPHDKGRTTQKEAKRRRTPRPMAGGRSQQFGIPTKIAFKLTILLGERSTELIHAPWSEIVDLDGRVLDGYCQPSATRERQRRFFLFHLLPLACCGN